MDPVAAIAIPKGRLFRPRARDPNWNSRRLQWCRQETRIVHAKVLPVEGETFLLTAIRSGGHSFAGHGVCEGSPNTWARWSATTC
jgi:hypothetical protein